MNVFIHKWKLNDDDFYTNWHLIHDLYILLSSIVKAIVLYIIYH